MKLSNFWAQCAEALENSAQRLGPSVNQLAQSLFLHPETAGQEQYACQLLCDFLLGQGFQISPDIAGLPTAFCAQWGSNGPQLGILAEYDALPDRFQAPDTPTESHGAGPGHACGHNLIGAVSAVAAAAAKIAASVDWMQQLPGIRKILQARRPIAATPSPW